MNYKILKIFSAGLFFLSSAISNGNANEDAQIQLKGATTFYEFGRIKKGLELGTNTIDNMWVQRFGGIFDLVANQGTNLNIYLGAGSIFWHPIPSISTQSASEVFYGDAILSKAYLQYKFGDSATSRLQTKAGYFNVKYGKSKNLGEYLFRTGAYPTYIITGNALGTVNTASAKVLGTQWTQTLGDHFEHSLLLSSERDSYPYMDFSLSYLADFKSDAFTFGAGLMLSRLIPVTPSKTTPPLGKGRDATYNLVPFMKNTYFKYNGKYLTFNSEYYLALAKADKIKKDTSGEKYWTNVANTVDSLFKVWDTTAVPRPRMESYTFKAVVPMVHASIDFGQLIGSSLFKKDDFLLYGESILLGVINQPIYYERRMDRLAMMAGLNIPTFGILNMLNIEAEYFPSKYVNGYATAAEAHMPLPDYIYDKTTLSYDVGDWKKDDWKWSVFIEKKLGKAISLQSQIASDHLRGRQTTRIVTPQSILIDKDHWYYMFKFVASI